ncbi:MAG: phosphatase domain-containing protein [Verrucomicrobiota bacterium]|nr:phosphatase domain-containing protein [Verrucomicrobiota bacterium]
MAGSTVEERLDRLRQRLARRTARFHDLRLTPFIGFGNEQAFSLMGRVLRKSSSLPSRYEQESIWKVVRDMYTRLASNEAPGIDVILRAAQREYHSTSDEEGFFQFSIEKPSLSGTGPWHTVELRLAHNELQAGTQARVLIPSAQAAFGMISDIDDTIVQTHATSLHKMARTVFLNNAQSRLPFPGVAALYRALVQGSSEAANPIFYISSGPWNFHDLLNDFMELNGIPLGPIMLQDFGLKNDQLMMASHSSHKLKQIRKVFSFYPNLPFILMGDSGQHDPEVYSEVLKEFPGRIQGVYIRDVSPENRDKEIRHLAIEASKNGCPMLLVKDSFDVAEHAERNGFIASSTLPEIRAEVASDNAPEPQNWMGEE